MSRALPALRDILLPPPACASCGRAARGGPFAAMCRACWRARRRSRSPRCVRCGLLLPKGIEGEAPLCGSCLREPPPYEAHVSRYLYAGPVRRMVLAYKEGKRYPLASLLGRAVAREVLKAWPGRSFDAVVPVPSPLLRRMARGFGPAELLARTTARLLGVPCARSLGLRKRPRPQKGLTRAQRAENVRAAFAVRGSVKGRTLLLVDDVTTTGATLRSAAAALQRAGAVVFAATFAQTPRRDLDLYGAAPQDAAAAPGPKTQDHGPKGDNS